jgi:hypothetical protein
VLSTFPGYATWHSRALGYSLRYDAAHWHVIKQDPAGLTLQASDGFSELTITGVPASRASASALAKQRIAALEHQLLGVTTDPDPADRILGPEIGLRPGIAGAFTGTVTAPQGPQTPVLIALMGAGDRQLSLVVTAIASAENDDQRTAAYVRADDIVNSIQWPPA